MCLGSLLLYVAELLKRVQNPVNGSSGKWNGAGDFHKSDRGLLAAALDEVFQHGKNLSHDLNVVFVSLFSFRRAGFLLGHFNLFSLKLTALASQTFSGACMPYSFCGLGFTP